MREIFLGIEQSDVDKMQDIVDRKSKGFTVNTHDGIIVSFIHPEDDSNVYKSNKLKSEER